MAASVAPQRSYSLKEALAMRLAAKNGIDPQAVSAAGAPAAAILDNVSRAKATSGKEQAKYIAAAQAGLRRLDAREHATLINSVQAKLLALQGRGGDTKVAHVTPGELVIPRSVLTPELAKLIAAEAARQGLDPDQFVVGGAKASVNPETGVEEFFKGITSSYLDNEFPEIEYRLLNTDGPIPPSAGTAVGASTIDPITVTATRRPEIIDPDYGQPGYLPNYFPVQSGQFRGTDDYGTDSFEAPRRGGATTGPGQQRPHHARDVRAAPGEDVVATVDGTVTNVGKTYGDDERVSDSAQRKAKAELRYVEITAPNGTIHRVHYVSPDVKVGQQVVGGATKIGTVQDLSPVYPVDKAHPHGMINHVHVEIADPHVRAYEKPEPGASDYTTYLRLDPTNRLRVPRQWQAP